MEIEMFFKNKIYEFIRERNFEMAEALLKREIEEGGENPHLYQLLGDVNFEMEREEEAILNYKKALEIAKDKGEELEILPILIKMKKLEGETNTINIPLCKIFMKYGLKEDFKNTFLNYFKGLLNSGKKEEGKKFIEGVFEDENLRNEFLFYFLSNFKEGEENLKKAISGYENKGNIEVAEILKSFIKESGTYAMELKNIIKIEGIEERKLEPEGTLELAELLDSIGSKEEALNEYLSSIYGFYVERNDINKCKEILEKMKKLEIYDERIEKVEKFLENPPKIKSEIKYEGVYPVFEKRLNEIVSENIENLKKIAKIFSSSFLHNEAIKIFENLAQKGINFDEIIEYYLYSLYETGEYEKILEVENYNKREIVDYFKALSYEKLGEKESALEILNEIYEKKPDFMDIEERIRKLKGEEILKVQEVLEEVEVLEEKEFVEEIKEKIPKKRKGIHERFIIIY
jgi:tetratricopeptide (TPR) repeat protein